MTSKEKRLIKELREQGLTFREIASQLGMKEGTVKSYCSRYGIKMHCCLQCGKPVKQTPHRKEKKFCSDKCRMTWWNHHPDQGNRTPHHTQVCPICNKEFDCFRAKGRTYCSRECYVFARNDKTPQP